MSKNLKGKKALVVDDEDVLRELLVVQLEDHEVEALEAACANDALDILQNQAVDFIISDVRMPNGTGVDLLKGVQAMEFSDGNRPEIVMMSGFSDLTEEDALGLGALKLFAKPFKNRDLIQYLDEVFGNKNEKKED